MTKQILSVDGMHCEHCVRAVKTSVSALAGVSQVEVSLAENQVTVGFDPAKTDLASIKGAIEEQGYTVR